MPSQYAQQLLNTLRTNFPWLEEYGFLDMVLELIQQDATIDQIVVEIRGSDQYRRIFPGMVDENGQRRFSSEREYIDHINDYRDVLREFSVYDSDEDIPMNYVAWLEGSVDPNELRTRFTIYRELERGSQETREAFYVYAGLDVSVDDLYRAQTDPNFASSLAEAYNQGVAASEGSYEEYIARATKVGLDRLAATTAHLTRQGLMDAATASAVLGVTPGQAQQLTGALFASNESGVELGLEELVASLEYALLASAASEQGLALPTRERLAEFRQLGVDRARAVRAYGQFAAQRTQLSAAADRANRNRIDQDTFERAALMGQGAALADLNRLLEEERAYGRSSGGFSTDLQGERLVQRGR